MSRDCKCMPIEKGFDSQERRGTRCVRSWLDWTYLFEEYYLFHSYLIFSPFSSPVSPHEPHTNIASILLKLQVLNPRKTSSLIYSLSLEFTSQIIWALISYSELNLLSIFPSCSSPRLAQEVSYHTHRAQSIEREASMQFVILLEDVFISVRGDELLWELVNYGTNLRVGQGPFSSWNP